ncbi:hypothetical protein MCEMSEM23_02581 [Rhabdaerophilaceae bacterium]
MSRAVLRHGIDTNAIAFLAEAVSDGRKFRYLKAVLEFS